MKRVEKRRMGSMELMKWRTELTHSVIHTFKDSPEDSFILISIWYDRITEVATLTFLNIQEYNKSDLSIWKRRRKHKENN